MGGFLSDLLSGIDCCERECEKIFCFRGQVKIKTPHKKDACSCRGSHREDDELDCVCECRCEKSK